jgi:biopolymer transport protein ExbD
MAMITPSQHGPGRFGPALSEINVTPLVDVILVLLIIFMVTAPMMTRGIDVRLPQTESGADAKEERLVVSIEQDNTVYLNDRPVNLALLTGKLKDAMETSGIDFVFLRADREVAYGRVMAVMDQVKKAGADRVGMVTTPAPKQRRGR